MDYKILESRTIDELQQEIHKSMREGFKPMGRYVVRRLSDVTTTDRTLSYYQTIYKPLG